MQWTNVMHRENRLRLVQSFIERCEAGVPIETLAPAFQETIEHLGFRFFACCSHVDPLDPPPRAIMVHNYPAMWVRIHSERRLHYIDPVFQHAERDPMPFFWDTAFRRYPITALQSKHLAEASKFGLAHGYTIPIHLSWIPGTLRASCSVVPDTGTIDKWSYRAVELMATYLFAALSRRHAPWRAMTLIELSHRERQCLTLAAEGKDDWAIGQLLGLSAVTVHTYIERAKKRLGVVTRIQAVVQALATGQISFGDVVRAQHKER